MSDPPRHHLPHAESSTVAQPASPQAPAAPKRAPLSPIGAFARRHDPDRYLCALFAPAARREALFALIAFNHELARAREVASEPMLALIRLQWWREVVEQAQAGVEPRRHEVVQPLHAALTTGGLDAQDLLGMLDAREAEVEGLTSMPALLAYLRGSAGGLAVAAGRLLGATGPALLRLQELGTGYGMAGILRSAAVLARHERSLLPEELLAAHGLGPEEAITLLQQGTEDARLRAVATAMAEAATPLLAAKGPLPRAAVAAGLPAILARRDLRRLSRAGYSLRPPDRARGLGDRLAVMRAGFWGRV